MKKIPYKLISILLSIVLIMLFISYLSQNASRTPVSTKLENYMQSYNKGNFSGSVLVADNEKIIFEKSYGMADYENNVPNKVDTAFRIGSLTKEFTAMSIMMLQERGRLNVNDKVRI